MEKRYNFRIYPSKAQASRMQQSFGCVRWVYNHFLALRVERYKAGQGMYGFYDNCKDLTKLKQQDEYKWLYDADANALQAALKELDRAYANFFRRVRHGGGEAPGFPGFRSKKNTHKSYVSKVTNPSGPYAKAIIVGERAIKLPKLGWVPCRVSKKVEGRVISATVCQRPSGKYYVSVCATEYEPKPLPKTGKTIDLRGDAADILFAAEREAVRCPLFFDQTEKKIARLHKALSRKTRDSANFEKARVKLAKAYERIAHQRNDFLHQLSTQLVRNYDVISVSDESFAGAGRAGHFSGPLTVAGWGELRSRLTYKCSWYGKELIRTDADAPSREREWSHEPPRAERDFPLVQVGQGLDESEHGHGTRRLTA